MSRTIAMLRPLCFAQWDRLFYFSGQAMKSLDVPKCKSICPQRLNPSVSIHLSSFAMSSSPFRDASEEVENDDFSHQHRPLSAARGIGPTPRRGLLIVSHVLR